MDEIRYDADVSEYENAPEFSYDPTPTYLDRIMVEELVSHLNQMERYLVKEIYYSGKSKKQIAEENGISVSAVRTYEKNLIQKLRYIIKVIDPEVKINDTFNPIIWSQEEGWENDGKKRL